MKNTYFLNDELGIWCREDHASFAYSDGDENEEYLRKVIAEAADLSSYSLELIAKIKDFASEYHLSPLRHNLLRPFDFNRSDEIVELGAGCGAMTRYLGERCGQVVSVEGSPRRAGIAASRCRDLPNVSVFCDSILTFRTEQSFDYVLLIGVLEYATKYGSGSQPVIDLLLQARSLLKPGGKVIIAIENKLGLKYFAGCAEDHHGIPFLGINDSYAVGETTTYGRRELLELLAAAGLHGPQVYYPFPDYKLPTAVLGDAALAEPSLNVADLLLTVPSRDYWDDRSRCFDEGLAQRALHRNGLLADMANSFLVFAGEQPKNPEEPWLCKLYNQTLRRPELAVETTFEPSRQGIRVSKRLLDGTGGGTAHAWHQPRSSPYVKGRLLLNDVRETLARGQDVDALAEAFQPWVDYLLEHAETDGTGKVMLPGNFVDCIPQNLLRRHDGDLHYFDAEWVMPNRIPLTWVYVHGVAISLARAMESAALGGASLRALLKAVAGLNGVALNDQDLAEAAQMGSDFFERITAVQRRIVFEDSYDRPPGFRFHPASEVARWSAEVKRVKRTVGWRITGPLRASWNLFRRITRA